MGKGGRSVDDLGEEGRRQFSWEEVKNHAGPSGEKWLVIDGHVYDVSQWAKRHPGGSRLISHYAGQDATEPVIAFHNNGDLVRKYMRSIHLGQIVSDRNTREEDVRKDFEELRQTAIKMRLFTPSIFFYLLVLFHLIFFETLAYLTMLHFGTTWPPYLLSVFFYTIVQAQAGWAQHDYGHLSVFKSTRLNHALHQFTMCFTKGAACDWWNHMHYQHHAKPNVMNKDPDVRLEALFVVGETMPKKVAMEKRSYVPYNWQHKYFFAIGPPLLFPVYFQYTIFRHTITRKRWLDLFVMGLFYLKILVLYSPMLGVWGAIFYYFFVRCMESHWFVWVSQSNHIPMEIDEDHEHPWVPLQLKATCDIEKSYFNDWFTGHLNFQIEHHLFPTMPRHNLYKISPLVKSLCEKHHIKYNVKTLSTAFCDVIRSLKHSGEIWNAYYQMHHHDE